MDVEAQNTGKTSTVRLIEHARKAAYSSCPGN